MKFTAKTFIFLAFFCLIFIAVDSQTASNTTSPIYNGPSTSGSSLSAVNTATSSSKPSSSGLPSYTPITYHSSKSSTSSSSNPAKFFIPFLIGFVTGIGVLVLICIAIFIFRKKRPNVNNIDILEIAGRDSREESR
ncbi:hypothetical protein Glove_136g9 [Diversispora epigaea]|uniref:Mid2 domain-containing protein n=1 Tax=Diversispora epigaea TaxID=1348612 RepID=A0A397J6F9_9GLOM|nr:hypothetical protein Glove_136g9 [Diversispora epigaea]